MLLDLILLIGSFLIGYLIIWGNFKPNFSEFFLNVSLALVISWLLVAYILKLYSPQRFEKFEKSFSSHFQTILGHMMLISTVVLLLKDFSISRILFAYGYAIFIISDTLLRLCLLFLMRRERESGRNLFKVVVIGGGQTGQEIFKTLKDYKGYGFKPLGIFDDQMNGKSNGMHQLSGNISQAKQAIMNNEVDEIYCALPLNETEKINDLIGFAEDNLIRFKMVPDFSAFMNRNIVIDYYGFQPVISLRNEPLSNIFNRYGKRIFDLAFSSAIILFVLSWLLPLVALLIKLDSRGPVFYFQNRSGKDYRTFRVWKLRSMTVTDHDDQFVQAQKNDARITRIGKIIRKLNIDELPQFINVFLGEMSVVGPRPHPIKLNEIYRPIVDRYMIRHLAKPGVTGLAQVRGFRGETTDPEAMLNRVRADVFYIENWSFLLDIKIILLTLWNMIKGEKNAY
jgi:Undecaprenyl-phosphate glucose phosphotransferase